MSKSDINFPQDGTCEKCDKINPTRCQLVHCPYKEDDSENTEHMKPLRKYAPFIPIIGIPLTLYFHIPYGDSGLSNIIIFFASGIVQAISGLILLALLC